MSERSGPETPFPMKEPGVPFPLREIIEKLGNSFFLGTFGPRIPPFPGLPPHPAIPAIHDGGSYPAPPTGYTQSPGKAEYKAYRLGAALFIEASGTLPNMNQIADLRMSSRFIYPPQFDFLIYTPTFTLPTLRPFSFTEQFGFPPDAKACVINDAAGQHVVPIEDVATSVSGSAPAFMAASLNGTSANDAVGYGTSLQEAFDNAVAQLPSQGDVADEFLCYKTVESGLIKGGFAGLRHYYCKVAFEAAAKPAT